MNVSSILPTDSDVLRSYKLMMQQRAQRAAEAVKQLTVVLTALGVTTVVAEYDGCGDSGQIESLDFRNATNESCAEVPDEVRTQVEELLYDLLGVRHGGWENNDGAFGSFSWSLSDNSLNHEHTERYTEYETFEHEGFGDAVPSEDGQ